MLDAETARADSEPRGRGLSRQNLDDLAELGELGLLRGIEFKLDEIATENPEQVAVVNRLRALVEKCDLPRYLEELDVLESDD